ncbi:hypothetical protein LTR17_003262 [Elasticomyces elasticus]|nr:hypothetical protein LTR17_003262 [Elasticomyces elasticus]
MLFMLFPLLGVAAVAIAGPLATTAVVQSTQMRSMEPKPTGRPILPRQNGDQTTYTLSECETVADPDSGATSGGCECAGYDTILPFLTNVADSASCSYTTFVADKTTANPYPYTTTLANDAIVAYASYPTNGDSTTLQAGTTLTLQMGATSSVNIGVVSDAAAVNALYTAISNSLVAACPTPTGGSTVTECASVAPITGISYIADTSELVTDGELKITVPLVSVSDADTLQMLIVAVASGVKGNANDWANTGTTSYMCDSCWDEDEFAWPTINLTNVPALYQALASEQTAGTDGAILVQDIEVAFALGEEGSSAFTCSDESLIFSGLAAIGALIPGWGFLSLGVTGSELRFGLSLACDAASWAGS